MRSTLNRSLVDALAFVSVVAFVLWTIVMLFIGHAIAPVKTVEKIP